MDAGDNPVTLQCLRSLDLKYKLLADDKEGEGLKAIQVYIV